MGRLTRFLVDVCRGGNGRLARGAVSVVALVAVVWWAARQPAPRLPHGAGAFALLFAALGVYALAMLSRAERWHRILRLGGVQSRRADAYGLTSVGYMGNNTMPARAGDILKTVLTADRAKAGKRTVLGGLLAERLLDTVVLGVGFSACAAFAIHRIQLPLGWVAAIAIAIVVVAAVATGVLWRRGDLRRRCSAAAGPVLAGLRPMLSRRGAGLLGLSAVVWMFEVGTYCLVAAAAGIDLDPVAGLYVVALANLVATVPAAPGYVGTFDGAVLVGVGAVAAGAHPLAVSFVILLRFVLFVPITVIGLAVLIARFGGASRLRLARSGARRASRRAEAEGAA